MQISEFIVRQLAEYRHQNNMTLRQLARETGISDTYISRVESHRIEPSMRFIRKATTYLVSKTQKKDVENGGVAGKVIQF